MHWWVIDYIENEAYALLLSHIFWVIFSITLHELSHGWAALWQGDDTPRRYGHMTGNPIVHMGIPSLVMFAIIGIAWGMMPVAPPRFRMRRLGRVIVSVAGPAMNLLLAFISLTALAFVITYAPSGDNFWTNVSNFLLLGGWLNIALAMLNLLPLWPLDGAQALMGVNARLYRFYHDPRVRNATFFVFLALFLSGFLEVFYGWADSLANHYLAYAVHLLN